MAEAASTPQAIIDLMALKAASLFTSTEETRYYLQGVCVEIEPETVRYIATDGHRLFAVDREIGKKQAKNTLLGTFIIPITSCAPFKKDRAYDPVAVLSQVDGLGMTMKFGSQVHVFQPIDGAFPDWRRVLPKADGIADTRILSFNWDYVASFQKAGSILEGGRPILLSGGEGVALVRFPSDNTMIGAVMPMRAPNLGFWLPDWAKRVETPEPAEAA